MKSIVKATLLLILAFSFSCSSDDDFNNEITVKNKIDLKINGLPPVHSIRGLSASFCCENQLSVSFEHWVSTNNGTGSGGSAFNLLLDKNGNLLGLWYKDYTHPNNEFHSPYFSPISTLNIENFQFTENQILKFKISGQIFKQTYNFYSEPEPYNIEAEIEIKEFSKCICGSFSSKVTNKNGLIFHNVIRTQQGNDIKYSANSNNGYYLEFNNFNQFFNNMPLGTYSFDENSTSQRIDFMKFIGVPRAFSLSIIPQEWLKYETSGSFEIMERYQVNVETVTKVKFNFVAKENGMIIHEFNNAIFETQM